MSRHRISFTEKRRRKLARKSSLERLELRNTMTEPISVAALSVSAMRGLAQMGIMSADGGNGAALRIAQAAQQAKEAQGQARRTLAAPQRDSIAIASASLSRRPAGGSGGAAAVPLASGMRATPKQGLPDDWLAQTFGNNTADTSDAHGISSPWQPASRPGGGAALPPRGGSGSGAQAATVALVQGHTAALQTPPAPASTPAIPFLPSNGSAHDPTAYGSGKSLGSHHAGSGGAAQGIGGSPPAPAAAVTGGGGPTTINENPSSEPSSSVGNGSGFSQMSFQYFPIYVMDMNNGVVLFNGQYQQSGESNVVNLYAQVKGTTVSTYSWTTSGLNIASSSGASTYNFQFTLSSALLASEVGSVTLTVTNTSSQQESETFYFVVPITGVVSLPSSSSWPVTIPPDLEQPGAPSIASQGVSVDADSGALDTEIDLPSYNPNIPRLSLTYNSMTANPEPIILVHHQLDPTQTTPTAVNATLTFNSTVGTTWYYNTSSFIPGDIEQIGLQANATGLSTGRYGYSVQVVDERSSNTTNTYTGTATVLNQSSSAFGDGWTLQGLEQITADGTSGVILSLGDNGESLWFAGNPAVGSNYTTPVGDFSTLTLTSSGYTRTLPDGTQIRFNSSGYETATIDLNNNHTTFSYNGSNQLTSIEDQYGNFTTFTYSSGHLSTIEDPASRFTTFTFSGSDLEAVQQADSSRVTYTYDGSGRMTQVQDQRSNITSIAYDSAERVGTISLPEGATQHFSSYQEQGWTNSGTSGSPAAATLQAEAATTYTDPNGNSFQYRPDWMGLGQLSESTDPYGNVSANDISTSNGLPYVSIDPLGRITQTVYDSQGSPVTIAYPDLTEDQYTYNSDSEPLTYEDGNNHTTSYTYNADGDLTVVQDPMHNLTTMTYTSTGQVQSVTDANNHTTSYLYDSQGRVTTVQFPNSTTNLYAYDSQGDVIKVTDGRGNSTTYSFDALDRETGETDALGDITTITMDAAGNVTKVQAPTPAGQTARTTTYAYDSMDRLTTVTDPLGYQTVYGLDNDGNVVTITDNMARVTTIQYDEMDRPVVTIDPMNNHVTTTYDADGEKLTVTDAMNRTTSYAYSVRGWVAQVTDPMGYIATYTYSPTGKNLGAYQTNLTQFEADANTYNADDELIAQQNGVGETTSYSYDGVGNVTTVEDPNTNVVSYVYNSVNELTEVIQPGGVTISYTYDNSGNQETTTDALGHTTTVLFDALDRATTLISAVSGTTTITYDSASRETSLTDPDGNKTQWAYNADDQVTTLTQPNSSTVTYIYGKYGELTDTTDADGRRTTYSYNADGDQTGETWVGASPAEKITYTYDADNEMTGADDAFATLTMAYNADGQLGTYVTSGPGTDQPTVTLTYGYDQLGDETSVKDSLSSQGIATYTFNNAMEMTNVSTSYGGNPGPLITFTYDNGGRLTNISRSASSGDPVNTTITYDSDNRVVTITDGVSTFNGFGWSNTPLATITYGYDSASRVTTEVTTDPTGTDTNTYT